MYRHYEIHNRVDNNEVASLEEIKAKKWREKEQLARLETRQHESAKIETNIARGIKQTIHTEPPGNVLAESPAASATIPPSTSSQPFAIFSDGTDETVDCAPEISKPVFPSVDSNPAVESPMSFRPARVSPELFESPKPAVSLLTPLRDSSIKRDNSHLTPLAIRHPTDGIRGQKEKPKATPTAVMNQVNDLVQNFFNSTTQFHSNDETKFQDDTPTRVLTRNVFDVNTPDEHAEAAKPTDGPRRFMIFNDETHSDLENSPAFAKKSSIQTTRDIFQDSPGDSTARQPNDSFDLSLVSAQLSQPELFLQSDKTAQFNVDDGALHSTRRVPDQASDMWITNPGEQTNQDECRNPWSASFVSMQLGQIRCETDEVRDTFDIRHTFSVGPLTLRPIQKLGEGNFAAVYLCESLFSADNRYAVKVQKEAAPWEFVVLKETIQRVRGTPIEQAVSDAQVFSKFTGSGHGVLVTSFYCYGTLLDLCAYARPLLVKKSVSMKPFTLFFAAQVNFINRSNCYRFGSFS